MGEGGLLSSVFPLLSLISTAFLSFCFVPRISRREALNIFLLYSWFLLNSSILNFLLMSDKLSRVRMPNPRHFVMGSLDKVSMVNFYTPIFV